jgi:hypothetical protein
MGLCGVVAIYFSVNPVHQVIIVVSFQPDIAFHA